MLVADAGSAHKAQAVVRARSHFNRRPEPRPCAIVSARRRADHAAAPQASSRAGTDADAPHIVNIGAWLSRRGPKQEFQITIMHRFQGGEPPGQRPQRRSIQEGTMPINLLCVRGVQVAACVVVCLALWPSVSQAFTEEDQRRLCTPDVFRLCSSEIPSRERIIACMKRQRASLSPGCRSVFGKPAQSASANSDRYNEHYNDHDHYSDRYNDRYSDRW